MTQKWKIGDIIENPDGWKRKIVEVWDEDKDYRYFYKPDDGKGGWQPMALFSCQQGHLRRWERGKS